MKLGAGVETLKPGHVMGNYFNIRYACDHWAQPGQKQLLSPLRSLCDSKCIYEDAIPYFEQ